jgi:hypothetical protein
VNVARSGPIVQRLARGRDTGAPQDSRQRREKTGQCRAVGRRTRLRCRRWRIFVLSLGGAVSGGAVAG